MLPKGYYHIFLGARKLHTSASIYHFYKRFTTFSPKIFFLDFFRQYHLFILFIQGLQTPRESFFFKNLELLGMRFFEAFGVFSFWYCEFLVHVFHYSIFISIKKLSLYIQLPNLDLNLGRKEFEI